MKKFIIFTAGLVILIGVFAIWYFTQNPSKKTEVVTPDITPTITVQEELLTWEDQAEFSFQYPASLFLDPHKEDVENYSHIELKSSTHSGQLIVWCKDANASDIESWVKKNRIESAIDTTLGGKPAKKTITGNNAAVLTTSAIRDGYLYQIEVKLEDREFWAKIYDTVSSTFKFVSMDNNTSQDNTGEAASEEIPTADYIEDEEVIE